MSDGEVRMTRKGAVATIVFDRPAARNAMTWRMYDQLAEACARIRGDRKLRVAVLRGAGGKAFVSGADISKFESERATKEAVASYNLAVEKSYSGVHEFPKPTIAMIRGYCIGGGVGLAASCDLRICSENARFAVPAAKLGLGYDFPGLKRLVDVVGPSFAKEIFFTARQFDANEAKDMGFVNRVVPDAEHESYVKNYADTIAANAPLTVNSVKYIVGEVMKDESARDRTRCSKLVAQCFASRDYVEGRTAFMEKRKPVFTGS